ncbi:MAG: CDP-glycerol glycerophosphotransferase family protein [Lachnospiraceae bacterium]|nr:CDP-glycerol glycerophosphotransferase family protein [Lachnospiraceae bacterium]
MDTMKQAEVSVLYFKTPNIREEVTLKALREQTLSQEKIELIPIEITEEWEILAAFNEWKDKVNGTCLALVVEGDEVPANYLERMVKLLTGKKGDKYQIAMAAKCHLMDEMADRTCNVEYENVRYIALKDDVSCIPLYFSGTVVKTEFARKYSCNMDLPYDAEKDILLRMLLDSPYVIYVGNLKYKYKVPKDMHFKLFAGVYDLEWYMDSAKDYMIPFLEEVNERFGETPLFVQYAVMYYIICRFAANINNRNRHVIEGDEMRKDYFALVSRILSFVDDTTIFKTDLPRYTRAMGSPDERLMFAKIKYNTPELDTKLAYDVESVNLQFNNVLVQSTLRMICNIALIDYKDGKWEIDGSINRLFGTEDFKYYMKINGKRYPIEINEKYSLKKVFGEPFTKRITFHVAVPIDPKKKKQSVTFVAVHKCREYPFDFRFASHTSRLSLYPRYNYWRFDKYIAYYVPDELNRCGELVIRKARFLHTALREALVEGQMFMSRKEDIRAIIPLRMIHFLTNWYYKRKNIWVFYDKLYKGGDSSSYLYKYAKKQKDHIRKYYLLDKDCPDYKRMRKEGFRPVKRGTLKHKMLFLRAKMMIVSNSTVFAFNDYPLRLSNHIRGLTDFDVVCVQHGMSIQKIAIAQNRLRDNTKLYYCASKYEIENLSKPVYDYEGYDALRLTGVPRYDGLVDRAKKQILISPTWRMQSAMYIMSNEGVERDYNPNFKETTYYKVFNSLINDERLLNAAKEYGYRLAYVLHPIVSPQAKDFDHNDYVDIIPSTGDMSYEDLFCESSLMVSDYSGVQFDFAYMRKPVVYLHHKDIPTHYEEGTFHYDTMAFGEICHTNDELIDVLIDYMKNGCVMKDEYRRRADDFFYFDDHNNCKRIYEDMIEYQKKKGFRV